MKQFLSLLLCAVLLLCLCPGAAASVMDESQAQQFLEYPLAGGTAWFLPSEHRLSWGSGLKGEVEIPSEIDGVPVKRISEFGAENPELTGITLPEGLEAVESGTFSNCPKLKTIRLSSTVREFPAEAAMSGTPAVFQVAEGSPYFSAGADGVLYNRDRSRLIRCPMGVVSYAVPEGVRELGQNAFNGCRMLASLTLPESLETISLGALGSCSALTSLHIPKNVTDIGGGTGWLNAAFTVDRENPVYTADSQGALYNKNMTVLLRFPPKRKKVSIPETVETIGSGAFVGSAASRILLPDGLKTIGDWAFNACAELTEIEFPQGLETIGENAFCNCALRRADLPASLKILGLGAFSSAYHLQAVVFPEDLETLGENAVDTSDSGPVCYIPKGAPIEEKIIRSNLPYRYGRPEDFPEGLPYPLPGTPYIDVPLEVYGENDIRAVKQAHAKRWMKGESDLLFCPENAATRAMAAAVLYRAAGSPEVDAVQLFPDVKPGSYYEKAADWAWEQKILLGSDGKMLPGRPITREEAAVILYRFLLSQGVTAQAPPPANFADRAAISSWALEAVDSLVFWGVLEEGEYLADPEPDFWHEEAPSFLPRETVSRLDLASLLYRAEAFAAFAGE